jgi:hypothetical protein
VISMYPHAMDLLIAKLAPPLKTLNGINITQDSQSKAGLAYQRHISFIEMLFEASQSLDFTLALEKKLLASRLMKKKGLLK